MRTTLARLGLLVPLFLGALPAAAPAAPPEPGPLSVERISGERLTAFRLKGFREGALVLEGAGSEVRVPLDDVIEVKLGVEPDAPRPREPFEVGVDLWSGESLHGQIKTGDAESITLATPLLGELAVPLEAVAAVRFLPRLALVAEPPDLGAREQTDVIHYVGGDRAACTIERFGPLGVTCATASNPSLDVPYERMVALRLLPLGADDARRPEGTALVAILRDGSRVLGTGPRLEGERLVLEGVSGFRAEPLLRDVVALHVLSDAFAYLSDLEPSALEVDPFWDLVAGEPELLYAPREDASFSGSPLRAGERSWLKGLGVYSGTSLTWDLGGRYSEFRTHAAVDDAAGELGAVVFEVLVDGERKWTSGLVRSARGGGPGKPGPIDAGRIDVRGAKTLTLRVLPGTEEDPWPVQDEADWLGAMVVR